MKTDFVKNSNRTSRMGKAKGKIKEPNQQSSENIFLEEQQALKKWFEDLPKDPEEFKPTSTADIQRLRGEAQIILENDTLHYKNKCLQGSGKSSNEWLQTMVTKGTSQDKIAASVILIQNSPIHSLHILRNLIGLVKVNKKECVKAMEVLTDLFISDLLIPQRKLRYFEKSPLSALEKLADGKATLRKMYLLLWYFEGVLKKEYYNFVSAVKDLGQGSVDGNKEKSIVAMQNLLVANPEQELLLLSMLVNKIGDPLPKVATKATFHLNKVVTSRPYMKAAVLEEIQKLLFRPNIGKRAQFYGICFLSQFLLDIEESELASKLINLYFSFFKACVKKGNVDSRMMSVLLTGVNRAFPFSKKDESQIKDHVETVYKIVHITHFNVSVQAMCLLFQACDYDSAISDRFYSVLYQKLIDPALSSSSQQAIFISLIFRSLSKDLQFTRVKTFIKRLLQVCHYLPVPLACAILVLISHLFKKNKTLRSLTLYTTEFKDESEGSDEEHYDDIKLEEEADVSNLDSSNVEDVSLLVKEEKKSVIPTWHHISNLKRNKNEMKRTSTYSRNPLFVSDVPVFTELVSLSTHYHPTVSLFASRLLEGALVEYPGDPLRDFTLSRFLDRWVFKNPKQLDEAKVSKFSRRHIYIPSDVKLLPVNSDDYLKTPENLIPPEELFMYRYFKKQEAEGRRPKKHDDDSDASSVASDEFEGIMSQLMGGKETINYAEEINKTSDSVSSKQKKKKATDEDSLDSEVDEMDEDLSDIDDDDDDDEEDEDGTDVSDEDEDYHGGSKPRRKFNDSDDFNDNEGDDDNDEDEEDDDDEEIMQFDSDGEEDFEFTMSDVERDEEEYKLEKKRKKGNLTSKKNKKLMKGIDGDIFAPAEEFAEMLEDTGEQIAKYGNLTNVSNKDNAGIRQLKWEMTRDQWVKGHGQKRKMRGKSKQPYKKWKRNK